MLLSVLAGALSANGLNTFSDWAVTVVMLSAIAAQCLLFFKLYRSDPGWIKIGAQHHGPSKQECDYCGCVPPKRSRHDFHTGDVSSGALYTQCVAETRGRCCVPTRQGCGYCGCRPIERARHDLRTGDCAFCAIMPLVSEDNSGRMSLSSGLQVCNRVRCTSRWGVAYWNCKCKAVLAD